MRATVTTATVLLAWVVQAAAADKPQELTPEKRQELETKALQLNEEGEQQYQRGNLVKARESFRELVEVGRALYPKEQFPDGHPALAAGLSWLARVYDKAREYSQAEACYRQALAMYRALYPKKKYPQGHSDLAVTINNLGFMYQSAGEFDKAEPLLKEALEMHRAVYPKEQFPNGHPNLAMSIGNLARLYHDLGKYKQAEPFFHEALEMQRALYPKKDFPDGHFQIMLGLYELGRLHKDAGDYGKAEPLYRAALDMARALFPKEDDPLGYMVITTRLGNLAELYQTAGEYGKAEPLVREALERSRTRYPREKYPRGHRELAATLNNLGILYKATGQYAKAEPLLREALEIKRALYPTDPFPTRHRDLAIVIAHLADLYEAVGQYGKAKPLAKEALDMTRALYPKEQFPNGHPNLARSINSLACLEQKAGEPGQAEPLLKESLAMCRALFPKETYPEGHPDLATMINNLAAVHHSGGEYGKAEPLLREALAMHRGLALRYADLAAEAEALNYLHTFPRTRDALLSATRHLSATESVYDALWDTRAALTRLQERRHRDLMASRDPDAADLADQLRRTRLSLAGLLLNPGRDLDAHRAAVQKLTDAKEDLEKRIARKLKLAAPTAVAATSPKRLAENLLDGTAFVDFYRYVDFEWDPDVKGRKGEKRTPRYAAFVIDKGSEVARVELKEAAPIEVAWAAWHKALTADRPDAQDEREAAAKFADLAWKPIRAALPANLKTVYFVPDGPLHQVPWGALPGRKPDTVLLDECAVCLVPHGPFLLERLREPSADRPGDTLLAYGGVDYAAEPAAVVKPRDGVRGPLLSEKKRPKWGDLPGTAREQEQIVALAKQVLNADTVSRSGRNASTGRLEEDLPKARYAHIATHGFFADAEFRSAMQFDPQLFEDHGTPERRGGARSPLVLSGLVLAGANRQGEDAAPDRGIITAEGLISLRLEGLELAVLSACETGLGAWGGGEGVYGLQRAFHVAGCRNVVASLWKVDDGATQALMALFYRNLWERKLDAAEALRQAQLTLYRHPEAVEVARKRGQDFSESDLPRVEDKPAEKPKRSPASRWAAFTFSGVRPPGEKPAK
jgi:CHAT domain-containing protein